MGLFSSRRRKWLSINAQIRMFICCSLWQNWKVRCANLVLFPDYHQQDATFLNLFISTDALHVSGGSSSHHQEHSTVHTSSGIVKKYCCLLVSWMRRNAVPSHPREQQYWLTIPEAECTVVCSWWWAEEPPEKCRASVEINKSRNVAFCWL